MPSQRPLRVLHLTAGSEPGGVSRCLVELCSAMTAAGHDVAVAGRRGPAHHLFESAGIKWVDVPLDGNLFALMRSAWTLRRYISDHPVDLLHTHYRKSTLVARRLQMHRTPPILFTLHLSGIPLGWRKWIGDFGDFTHAPSQGAQQWLIDQAGVKRNRVAVVPHGVKIDDYPVATPADRAVARTNLGLAADDLVAAYVGRFDTPKNEGWMLDFAAATRSSLPNLKVLMQGEGPNEPDIRKRIESQGLADRVKMVPAGDPRAVYTAAHALLLPSEREGFGLVCAEAMAKGTPVLRTRTAGSAALILENITGCTCDIDHDAFIKAATDFMSDKQALARMGDAASRHIRDRFTHDRQVEETIELYRRVIAEG